jgi:hypothetical protein
MQQKLENTLKEIEVAISKLSNGNLTIEDMDALVDHAHSLYETSLILRYKAYETKVFGSIESHEPIVQVENEEVAPALEEILITIEEPAAELPQIEFSLFDDVQATEVTEIELTIEQEVSVIEETHIEETWVLEETVVESVVELVDDKNELEPFLDEPFSLEKSDPQPVAENDAFMEKFNAIDPSIANQIAMSRLDTLIGSFGLNERLQFINELFDGSSDDFSGAVKQLDQLANMDAARTMLAELSQSFNWDTESEIVEDFLYKICRRHAAGA